MIRRGLAVVALVAAGCAGGSSAGSPFCDARAEAQEAVDAIQGGSLIEGKDDLELALDELRETSGEIVAADNDGTGPGAKQITQIYVDTFLALDQPDGYAEFQKLAPQIPSEIAAIDSPAPDCD